MLRRYVCYKLLFDVNIAISKLICLWELQIWHIRLWIRLPGVILSRFHKSVFLPRNLICFVDVGVSGDVPDAKVFHIFNLTIYKPWIGVFSKWRATIGRVLVFRTVIYLILVVGFSGDALGWVGKNGLQNAWVTESSRSQFLLGPVITVVNPVSRIRWPLLLLRLLEFLFFDLKFVLVLLKLSDALVLELDLHLMWHHLSRRQLLLVVFMPASSILLFVVQIWAIHQIIVSWFVFVSANCSFDVGIVHVVANRCQLILQPPVHMWFSQDWFTSALE